MKARSPPPFPPAASEPCGKRDAWVSHLGGIRRSCSRPQDPFTAERLLYIRATTLHLTSVTNNNSDSRQQIDGWYGPLDKV